jgi:hypothetical protein
VCPCPHGCHASVKRKKSDFFAVFVRFYHSMLYFHPVLINICSPNSRNISNNCTGLSDKLVHPAAKIIALPAVSP